VLTGAGENFPLPPLFFNVWYYYHCSEKEKSMLSENQRKIFAEFHKSVEVERALDEKTSHLIKVAAAMAFGCYP
jgi:hypothetical protein